MILNKLNPVKAYNRLGLAITDYLKYKKYKKIILELDASGKIKDAGFGLDEDGNLYLGIDLNPELLLYSETSQESVELKLVSEKLKNSMTKALEEARANTTDKTAIERAMQQGYDYVLGKVAPKAEEKRAGGNEPISSLIEGKQSQMKDAATQTGSYAPTAGQNSKVEMGGVIKIEITAPPGFSDEKMQKIIYDKLNEQGFKDYVLSITTPQNSTRGPVPNTYSR